MAILYPLPAIGGMAIPVRWMVCSPTATPTDGTYIEVIVDGVLQVFHHSGLLHELVLVMVHAHKGTNMGKDILKGVHKLEGICKLEGINVGKLELDMGINDM